MHLFFQMLEKTPVTWFLWQNTSVSLRSTIVFLKHGLGTSDLLIMTRKGHSLIQDYIPAYA